MAIAEACQLWIEQRIEEELQDHQDDGKAVLRMATELQAEIEKVFQAKLSIPCLRSRIARQKCANAQQPETPATTPVKGGNTGNKLTPQEVVVLVASLTRSRSPPACPRCVFQSCEFVRLSISEHLQFFLMASQASEYPRMSQTSLATNQGLPLASEVIAQEAGGRPTCNCLPPPWRSSLAVASCDHVGSRSTRSSG